MTMRMEGIYKRFGATHALRGINFSLLSGEVHALLGENGAGKSTLIKILGGIYRPDAGIIYIDDQQINMDNVHAAQQHGISIIHQEIVLVPHLSITENIFLGQEIVTRFGLKNMQEMERQARKMTAAIGLSIDVKTLIKNLTIAQQQMVEIVKAVSFNANILVMDEPTSSLSDEEVETLFQTIERLRKNQVSIIYISHRIEELFRITDRITVIRDGTYVGTRITKETNADELVSMMVGRKLENYYMRNYSATDIEVLRTENITRKGIFKNISFTVHRGEILGFSGLVGSGRSEVMSAIFGSEYFDSGDVYLNEVKVQLKNPGTAITKGISFVPEDRKKQGLTLVASVGFNIVLSSLKQIMCAVFISTQKRSSLIMKYINALGIKTLSHDIAVSSLSGGNQQKVVLAKWLATNPQVLILDEPTRGVDVGAKSEIYRIIDTLANKGMAIIIVSSELPEIINMCDRVCVMRNGEISVTLEKEGMTQEKIMLYATGGVKHG